MERVGVSNSLLGTYQHDPHWDLPVILPLAMMKNVWFWLRFLFFACFTSAASKFCQNAVTSTDASLGADVSISTAACVFNSLTCLAYNLATWVPHSWNKLSCSACVNSVANCGYAKVFVLTERWGTFEYKFSSASSRNEETTLKSFLYISDYKQLMFAFVFHVVTV